MLLSGRLHVCLAALETQAARHGIPGFWAGTLSISEIRHFFRDSSALVAVFSVSAGVLAASRLTLWTQWLPVIFSIIVPLGFCARVFSDAACFLGHIYNMPST